MSALLHPEPKAAIVLAFRPRRAQILAPDHRPELACPAALRDIEGLNRPILVLREICCAIAAPVAFVLMLQSVLVLFHAL